jgi:hypothetical protein
MASVAHMVETLVLAFYQTFPQVTYLSRSLAASTYEQIMQVSPKNSGSLDTITISNLFIRGVARAAAGARAIILLLAPIIVLNAVMKTVV